MAGIGVNEETSHIGMLYFLSMQVTCHHKKTIFIVSTYYLSYQIKTIYDQTHQLAA